MRSFTGTTTVTSDGGGTAAAGSATGCAIPASSRRRASAADVASVTVSLPSTSRSAAACDRYNIRGGDPPSSTAPSSSTRARRPSTTVVPCATAVRSGPALTPRTSAATPTASRHFGDGESPFP